MHVSLRIALRAVALASIALSSAVARTQTLPAARFASGGTYKDASGGLHAWQITPAHTLVWENTPYLPVGRAFVAHSLNSDSDEAWQEDRQTLAALKQHGVTDVVVSPSRSMAAVPAKSLQRLIDELEAGEFRYGIAFGQGITRPLSGYVVRPTIYRYFEKDAVTATWQVTNTDSGLFALVDIDNGNRLVRADSVAVTGSVVTLPTEAPSNVVGRVIAQFYPHKTATDSGLPDLWGGFDDYRDRLLALLAKVKFGKGLRFFQDPIARRVSLAGETDFTIPDSAEFRLEWEGFLEQRYGTPERAYEAWSLGEGSFASINDLVYLVPLWEKTHGIPYFFNTMTGKALRIQDAGRSRWWSDFLQYRDESIQYYMNSMADILKKQAAGVPVVYTWTQTHPAFVNRSQTAGFDGLSIPAHAPMETAVQRALAPGYSHVEQSDRALWCVASEVTEAAPTAPPRTGPQLTANVPADSAPISSTLDQMRRFGVKGFFAGSLLSEQGVPATPAELDGLRSYGARLSAEPQIARYMPRILFFPQSTPGPARPGPIPGATAIWLSSYTPGQALDWWPAYSGYTTESNQQTVLVSLKGKRETHIWVPDPKKVSATTADGTPVAMRLIGKSQIVLTLDSSPTVFRTGGQRLILQEAAEDAVEQLTSLYRMAQGRKLSEAEATRLTLDQVVKTFAQRDYENAYSLAIAKVNELTATMQPYIWMEGERPRVSTFDEAVRNPEASGDYYLSLFNHNLPPQKYENHGYGVHFDFDVAKDGFYSFWLAGSLPGPSVSPIVWRIDAPPDMNIAEPNAHGPKYFGDRFGWMLLGQQRLTPGQHTLMVFVPERAISPSVFSFAIDAVMITEAPFRPNGALRPPPLDAQTVKQLKARKPEKPRDPFTGPKGRSNLPQPEPSIGH